MSGNTEESARFKKVNQTVGGGDTNNVVGNTNDEVFKSFGGHEQNVQNEPRSADSARERDLQEKGYTDRATDKELDETEELRAKLSKRGNAPQEGASA